MKPSQASFYILYDSKFLSFISNKNSSTMSIYYLSCLWYYSNIHFKNKLILYLVSQTTDYLDIQFYILIELFKHNHIAFALYLHNVTMKGLILMNNV